MMPRTVGAPENKPYSLNADNAHYVIIAGVALSRGVTRIWTSYLVATPKTGAISERSISRTSRGM